MRKEPPRGEEVTVAAPDCYCGRLAWLLTSWIKSNPLWRGGKKVVSFLYELILKCLPVREL
ncbi:unnamed protein product [Prunus armeniaca]